MPTTPTHRPIHPARTRTPDATPQDQSHTLPQAEGESAPRLPHERDESSDSQTAAPRAVIQQAHHDLENGLVDTDRGPVMDTLYENKVRPAHEATRDRAAPADKDA